jgi:hypothetical protein
MLMRTRSLAAKYILAALVCSSGAAFAQKAGVVTRFVAPAMIVQPPAKPGLQEVSAQVAANAPIKWKDILRTGDGGRLRAQLNDGSILSLGSKSQLVVQKHDEKKQQSAFDLTYGQVRAQVVHLAQPDSSFEVRTNTAVCGVLGTDGVFDGSSPAQTVVIVISGVVAARNSDPNVTGSVTLTAGQFTVIRQGQAPTGAQQANSNQINGAVTGTTGNTAPQGSVTLSTLQVPYGGTFTLNATASSGGLGTIINYAFSIPSRNFNQSGSSPILDVPTTNWPAGTYPGMLTVTVQTDPSNPSKTGTATAPFQFTILPPPNPADTVAGLASAYTNLQPAGFTQWFDPAYPGTSALTSQLEQAIPTIQALQATYPTPQVSISGNTATCTTNFSFKISPKPVPPATTASQFTYTTGSVTLTMALNQNTNRWLINGVIGALGSAGMLSVPGTTSSTGGNTVGGGNTGTTGLLVPTFTAEPGPLVIANGPILTVYAGGAVSSTIVVTPQNGFTGQVTVSLGPNLPLGITVLPISPVQLSTDAVSFPYILKATPTAPTGEVLIPFTAAGNGVTQTGEIALNVQRLALASPPASLALFAGSSTTAAITVSVTPGTFTYPVTLTANSSDPGVTASVSDVFKSGTGGTATLTVVSNNSAMGSVTVTVIASQQSVVATTSVTVNLLTPILNASGPGTVAVAPGQPAAVPINVPFNTSVPGFTGSATVTPPSINGLTFTPASVVLTQGGVANFQVTASAPAVLASPSGTFTITAGKYSITVPVLFNVFPAFDFTLTGATVNVSQGGSAGVSVQVTPVPNTGAGPLPVAISVTAVPPGITVLPLTGSITGSGAFAPTVSAAQSTATGQYAFTVNGVAGISNHSATVSVTVQTPPALTITANNKSRTYGAANPVLDASYAGLVNGDTPASLTGTLTCTTTATPASSPGSYPITCSGQSSAKYTITYAGGTLSVTPAPLTITANNKSRTFATANPAFDASYSGFVLTDTIASLSGTLTCTTTAGPTSPAGNYPITCSGQTSTNYAITYVAGTLIVTGLPPLTVTANNKTRAYGAANPAFDVSYAGFLGSDSPASLGGTLTCSTTATAASPVGTYPITCSGQTSNTYSIIYVSGTLTVTGGSSTTTLLSNPNPSTLGGPVTFTATVSPSTATGTVTFKDGPSTLGSATVTGGQATFLFSSLSAGTHSITAAYSGDANVGASTSPALSQVVNAGSTQTSLVSAPNPSTYLAQVTFTAIVSPSNATGNVLFKDGAATLGSAALSAGQAAFSISSLSPGTHSITALYNGDSNYIGSLSGVLSQTVNQGSSTTTVGSSVNPSAFAQSVTFTVTVSPNTATGMVTLKDGSTTLGTGNLSGGSAMFSTSQLSSGNHSITAVYAGDSSFNGSTSSVLTQSVNLPPTTTAVVSSLNPSTLGQSVMFTATVTPSSATGTVTFKDGAASLGTGTLSLGQATFSSSALTGGTHSITAVYGGDSNDAFSTSPALSQVVNKATTTTSVNSSASPSTFGTSVTFTANVTPSTATGTVTFMDGTLSLGSGTLTGGQATFSTANLTGGTHSITAVYGGDTNYSGSTSGTLSQVVNGAATTTSLISSLNPSTLGASVTFTATVSSTLATGIVTFKDGGSSIGVGTLSGGQATFSTSALSVGTHSITAVYSSDSNFNSSASSALVQVVNVGSTTTTVTSGTNPSSFGQSVSFTATVTPSTATGMVTFKDGSTTLGTGTLVSGSATFATTALASGSHSITAVYGGDSNYSGSTSSTLTQSVGLTASTTSVVSSLNPSIYGQSVTFTATVTSGATGTVTFKDGATTLGTGTLSSGQAAFSTSALTGSSHSITAVYGGDSNYAGSTSSVLSQVVNTAATTTGNVSSLNPTVYGQSVTFTATVTPSTATGTVTFKDGTTVLGIVNLSSGQAAYSTSALTAGTHSITAVYGGDVNYSVSTSSTLSQVVAAGSTTVAVVSSLNPSTFGTSVTFTATVSAQAPATGTATGTVTFKDGSTALGTGTLSSGQATFSISTLSVATHSITAVYAGDSNFTGSTSPTLSQVVNSGAVATTTTLGSSLNPSTYGATVVFNATVSPNTATGTLFFKDGSTTLISGTLGFGTLGFSTASLGAGTHSITAVYGGDANDMTSTSSVLTQTINPAPLTITANNQTISPGGAIPTLTVTYSGFVNFDNANSLTGTLNCGTTATMTSPAGSYPITCSGQSSPNYSITYVPGTLTIFPTGGGVITAGSVGAVSPGGTANVPIVLVLGAGVSVDSLSFGLQVTPNGSAPAITTGTFSFTPGSSIGPPSLVDTGVAPNLIAVSWSSLSPAIAGTIGVGTVGVMTPAGTLTGQTFSVQITGASGTFMGSPVTISPGGNATLTSSTVNVQSLKAPTLVIRPNGVTATPAAPRDGDIVRVRVRVSNNGVNDARNVLVALQAQDGILTSHRVNLAAGRNVTVNLEWKADHVSSRQLSVAIDPNHEVNASDSSATVAPIGASSGSASSRQSRMTVQVRNEACAGVRFANGSQSGCGGAVDIEVTPVITSTGTLEVRLQAPGGIRDMGAMTLSSTAQLPPPDVSGLQPQGTLQQGHTYLLKLGIQVGYFRVARIRSSVDPRLAAPGASRSTAAGPASSRGGSGSDVLAAHREQEQLDRILDNAQITIDLEWLTQ